jgi:putative hemolysin
MRGKMKAIRTRAASDHGLFNLDPLTGRLAPPIRSAVEPALSSLLCLPKLNEAYDNVKAAGADDFCKATLDYLDIDIDAAERELAQVPEEGPVIVVANHPFGGIEGLVLGYLLRQIRPDVRLLANDLLAQIPEMAPLCIFVDALQTGSARRTNIRGLHQAIDWTKDGGCLAVFPGGEVSSWDPRTRRIADPPWKNHIANLVKRTGASVVPIFFDGRNRALFHIAGLINPYLRTVLLPRELLSKQHQHIPIRVGSPIGPERLDAFHSNASLMSYLRGRTYALAHDKHGKPVGRRAIAWKDRVFSRPESARGGVSDGQAAGDCEAVAPPMDTEALERELAALAGEHRLAENGDLAVYLAEPAAMANLLPELGRLREVTFRAVGEGTGRRVDLDSFDHRYHHLLIWDRKHRRLVGGYRLGPTDTLRAAQKSQLYIDTLFRLKPAFFDAIAPSVELGRSFVRCEYQRSFTPLMLLWRAIGQFVASQPRYRHLIGPVTISANYSTASQALLVDALSQPAFRSELGRYCSPRHPFKGKHPARGELGRLATMVEGIDHLDSIVRDIEPDGKGVPILLKQYLKLGARCVAFNRDPDFSDCLDCLCVFDVLASDRRMREKYMGRPQSRQFLAAHGEDGS